jgi:DNA-directed RNA polymerase subunit beta
VSAEIEWLTADEEDLFTVAQANAPLNGDGTFAADRLSVRYSDKFLQEAPERVDYMDVSPKQTVSVATALIPFLEHDDANRALMGSNMQRQAVPLLQPEAPLVGTGMEAQAAQDSGQVLLSRVDGIVEASTGKVIVVVDDAGEAALVPAPQVRAVQPGNLHQPEANRVEGTASEGWATPGG